jgi:hypothetical protein
MINVNQITSMLAKMPDTSLQQYAALHKNDPYIMALAVSESNRRKEMRAGAQAPMGAQEQPKVVDQAVQGMAEDQGIAALPAGDMNFADGGIVAFAGGGLSNDNPAAMGVLAPLQEAVVNAKRMYEAAAQSGDSRSAQLYLQNMAQAQSALDAAAKQQFAGSASQGITAAQAASAPTAPAVALTGTPDIPSTKKGAAAEDKGAPTLTAGIGAPRAGGFSDYAAAKAGLADLYKTPDTSEYEQARKAQAGAGVGIAQEAAGRTQEFFDKLGEFGLKQEERLKEREGKLEKDTAQNKGLAILEAGLAMMSGTSANAFENIGKGALAGVGNYKKGLAALNERKDRLDDAYNQLETARYSDKKDRFQQMEAAQKNVDAAKMGIYQATTDIAAKKTELSAQQAKALADATVKSVEAQRDRQSRESIAAAPGDTQKLYMALGGGDLKKGFEVAKQMESANKKDVMTQYTEWLKANPTLAMDPNKAMAEFMKQSLVMGGIGAPKLSTTPTGQIEGKLK